MRQWAYRSVGAVTRWWRTQAQPAQALRAALAAAMAWLITGFLPGPASDYPYYAPFGAVIATTLSLVGSVRESLQAIASIALGGVLAFFANAVPIPGPILIALTVGIGVLLASLTWLGSTGMWIPTAAIFTLIAGDGEAFYVGAYAGLTAVGAILGVAINAIFPPLPLEPVRRRIDSFRHATADDLRALADYLEQDPDERPKELENWTVFQTRSEMYSTLGLAREAARGNRRGRKQKETIDNLSSEATRLDRLSNITNDLKDLLLREQHLPSDHNQSLQLDGDFFPPLITALRTIADILAGNLAEPDGDAEKNPAELEHDKVVEVIKKLEGLQTNVKKSRGQDPLADTIFMTLRRGLDSLQ